MPKKVLGFTLIELLIVIAVISVLAAVVVIVINPFELLRQGRDSKRLSDLATVTNAINIYETDVRGTIGTSSIAYLSLPDAAATSTAGDQCQSWSPFTLPPTFTYNCAASSTVRAVNGFGWIPINFNQMAAGSPLDALPIDPLNASSSGGYYTFSTNGTLYDIAGLIESQKYKLAGPKDAITGDGGTLASLYEAGTKLNLQPLDYADPSLVGYWSFNETATTTVGDNSGYGASGGMYAGGSTSTAIATDFHVSSGCRTGDNCGSFNGNNDFVDIPGQSRLDLTSKIMTLSAWINWSGPQAGSSYPYLIYKAGNQYVLAINGTTGAPRFAIGWPWSGYFVLDAPTGITANAWHLITATYDGTKAVIYVDGNIVLSTITTVSAPHAGGDVYLGCTLPVSSPYPLAANCGPSYDFKGLMSDVRIYNRALSGTEVQSLFLGGK